MGYRQSENQILRTSGKHTASFVKVSIFFNKINTLAKSKLNYMFSFPILIANFLIKLLKRIMNYRHVGLTNALSFVLKHVTYILEETKNGLNNVIEKIKGRQNLAPSLGFSKGNLAYTEICNNILQNGYLPT